LEFELHEMPFDLHNFKGKPFFRCLFHTPSENLNQIW